MGSPMNFIDSLGKIYFRFCWGHSTTALLRVICDREARYNYYYYFQKEINPRVSWRTGDLFPFSILPTNYFHLLSFSDLQVSYQTWLTLIKQDSILIDTLETTLDKCTICWSTQNQMRMLLLVDLFDSASWSYINKTLAFLVLEDDISKWFNILHNGARSCLTIKGSLSLWLPVEQGCKPGDTLSLHTFLSAALRSWFVYKSSCLVREESNNTTVFLTMLMLV